MQQAPEKQMPQFDPKLLITALEKKVAILENRVDILPTDFKLMNESLKLLCSKVDTLDIKLNSQSLS